MARCTKTTEELSAYIDGEVSPEEELLLRRHLDRCPTCQQTLTLFSALKDTVASAVEVYPLPHALRVVLKERPQSLRWPLFSWTPFLKGGLIAALVLFAFIAGAGLVRQRRSPQPEDLLASTLVAQHQSVSPEADELGISSEDPDVVAAWFQTQLSFPVRVPHLAEARLLGGRIKSLGGAPIALVSYEQEGARLSLFTLPPRVSLREMSGRSPSGASSPQCSIVLGAYALCLQESEEALQAVVTEGATKGEEFARRLLFPSANE